MMRACVIVAVLGIALVSWGVYAQSPSPVYYGAQVGGGTIAALAGGAAGTLVGGLSGILLGLPFEMARSPAVRVYQGVEDLEALAETEEPLPVRWALKGAKVGFGMGVGVGAAWGVIWVGKLFGIDGDVQGAFTGAFAGSLVGMLLLSEPQKYPFSFQGWSCKRVESQDKIQLECGYTSQSLEPIEVLLSPMVLAALGATIGYNAKIGFTISVPIANF